jgi:hypothetical protein
MDTNDAVMTAIGATQYADDEVPPTVEQAMLQHLSRIDRLIDNEEGRISKLVGWLDSSRDKKGLLENYRRDFLAHLDSHGWKPTRCDEGCPLEESKEGDTTVYRCAEHGWMGSAYEQPLVTDA